MNVHRHRHLREELGRKDHSRQSRDPNQVRQHLFLRRTIDSKAAFTGSRLKRLKMILPREFRRALPLIGLKDSWNFIEAISPYQLQLATGFSQQYHLRFTFLTRVFRQPASAL
jgi:hypothetical protein